MQPDLVSVSGASGPRSAYVAGRSDGRVYRRVTHDRWERVRNGRPEPASTMRLCAAPRVGELWAADVFGAFQMLLQDLVRRDSCRTNSAAGGTYGRTTEMIRTLLAFGHEPRETSSIASRDGDEPSTASRIRIASSSANTSAATKVPADLSSRRDGLHVARIPWDSSGTRQMEG
jgi:hypothetical protein